MDISNLEENSIEHFTEIAYDLRKRDISHEELGTVSDFQEAERTKNDVCSYLISIIERANTYSESLNDVVFDQATQKIVAALKQIAANSEKIEVLAEQGPHNEKFSSQRESLIASFNKQQQTIKQQLHSFELDLKLSEIQATLSQASYIETMKSEADEHVEATKKAAAQVEKVLSNLQTKSTEQGVEETKSHFGSLTMHHRRFERAWFFAFIVATVAAIAAVFVTFNAEVREVFNIKDIYAFIKHALLISAAGVAMRICLTKYNTERKLRITYEHRQKVLDQYRSFEAGIGDDNEAKNDFRLEIAKYIFSDPKSGYDQVSVKGTEINLNPVIGALEKAASR